MSAVPTTGTLRQRQEPLRSRPYLDYLRSVPCVICGDIPSEAAHFRAGLSGGTGYKPPDNLCFPLCHTHHLEQSLCSDGEVGWWLAKLAASKSLLVEVLRSHAGSFFTEWSEKADKR